ncbi:tetratricopeptide repeat protein [Streptomyces sp. NBC_00365]|uniref:tetratricopeptide repeat protein n=1 Tax=Streptomyces sp. NBC_00365 TaxID=2975726 RepID=UPI0022503DDC|nr:tetratricopeptide repeat protein [Streptomyces sp. NBC_00365]MCX5097624.1 tetratricopeptide repeat protein [Streptomyces sp. NBC_00365]
MLIELSESRADDGAYDVAVRLSGGGHRYAGGIRVRLDMSAEDREKIRWYFEDFLRFPAEPAPRIARDTEAQLRKWGLWLGRKLAGALLGQCTAHGLEDLWAAVVGDLADVRVEIASDVPGAGLPWELLVDPGTGLPIAAHAGSFVRVHTGTAHAEPAGRSGARPRVLLVVSRPDGADDVPFRDVAERLLRCAAGAPADIEVDVLRPPTFARLGEVLGRAAEQGRPYDVVHFDGHGTDHGTVGHLAFEQPAGADDTDPWDWVPGETVAGLLRDCLVRLLVMNACRSAWSGNPLGSLAQEAARAGVPGVVAMQYNVTVGTAARFVAGFYGALFVGHTLGTAAGLARRRMLDDPTRGSDVEPLTLQDWSVPLVYEAEPMRLVPVNGASGGTGSGAPRPVRRDFSPPVDDADGHSLIGRDSVILELDRGYGRVGVVLLSGLAGSGKTLLARTFASWYRATGGLRAPRGGDGPVLFTSFADLDGLDALLDVVGAAFPTGPDDGQVAWDRLDREAKMQRILDIAADHPLLWIWDAVDTVAGVSGPDSRHWRAGDTEALGQLLARLAGTRARVLLTSRLPETRLLQGMPAVHVALSRLSGDEQVALVLDTATRVGLPSAALVDATDLLDFADGNPRVTRGLITVAAARGVADVDGMSAFVRGLHSLDADRRPGHSLLGDDASLAMALAHGIRQAVSPQHRQVLASLHLFRSTAQSSLLAEMTGRLPDGHGWAELTQDECRRILEACAGLGLIEGSGQGDHRMHPALAGLLSDLFGQVFGPPGSSSALLATRAYVESVARVCGHCADELEDGNTSLAGNLVFADANLRHARELALAHGWGHEFDSCTGSLAVLHRYLGNREHWAELVDELAGATTDPATGEPRPGREGGWYLTVQSRVRSARDQRDWLAAEELEHTLVRHARTTAAQALAAAPGGLSAQERRDIMRLAVCLGTMGQIRREQGEADCLQWFDEALDLQHSADHREELFSTHYNIAEAYRKVPAIRDLDRAEWHFLKCLDLAGPDQRLKRIGALGELGLVAWLRHEDAEEAGVPQEERRPHLVEALWHYNTALADTPVGAYHDAATFHNQLGLLHLTLGDDEAAAREHLQEAQRLFLLAEEPDGAGRALCNLAFGLLDQGRLPEARPYLVEALRHLEPFGDRLDLVDSVRRALALVDAEADTARADPLAAIQEVVATRMRQAADDPARLPALANALSRLGIELSAQGRHQEALQATREAVDLLERLAAVDPATHAEALASALHNFGNRHSYLRQFREAREATGRSARIRAGLAAQDLPRHGPELAATLRNLAEDFWAEQLSGGALAAARGAVEVWRNLVAADAAAHEVSLAKALDELAGRLDRVGRYDEARACLEESSSIWRRQTEWLGPSHERELAAALLNLSGILLMLGRPEESLAAARESVAVLRSLASDGSAGLAVRQTLANALGSLGTGLFANGEREKAARVHEESIAVWRDLVGQGVEDAPAGLATTLVNLGVALTAAGHHRAAREALKEGVELLRPLAARGAVHRQDLAEALKALQASADRPKK